MLAALLGAFATRDPSTLVGGRFEESEEGNWCWSRPLASAATSAFIARRRVARRGRLRPPPRATGACHAPPQQVAYGRADGRGTPDPAWRARTETERGMPGRRIARGCEGQHELVSWRAMNPWSRGPTIGVWLPRYGPPPTVHMTAASLCKKFDPPIVLLIVPTIWPRSLIAGATERLTVVSGERSRSRPFCHRNACKLPVVFVWLVPTTWPRLLIATAPLIFPPSVPRSRIFPFSHKNACMLPFLVWLAPLFGLGH